MPVRAERGSTSGMVELAHDLANVFQTIRQANDLIADGPTQADLTAVIARSVAKAERLLGLGACGGASSLGEAIEKARAFAADACRLRGLAFEVKFSGDEAKLPDCDLERVFTNLFVNAMDAVTAAGGSAVRVIVEARRRDADYQVTVTDNGGGIPSEMARELFKRGATSHGAGRGLGLHIVRVTIAQCGGSVCADNLEQGGARFTLRFPAAAMQ